MKVYFASANSPEVCIDTLGCLEGVYKPNSEGEQYEAFYGVPFAKPPVGELRFKNPVAVEPWENKLLVKEPKAECIQHNYLYYPTSTTGEEDCLYLNVYRPVNSTSKKLPVLFYIYGGGYSCGSENPILAGPEYFMDTKEVILVIPGYRLGIFGFLSTGDEQMSGNFGLKDQNLALQWVNKYIDSFGGDPTRVTIFGHSAGGSSVHYQMLSPASKGLFRNAILVSGTAISPFINYVDAKPQVVKLANAAGFTNTSQMSTSELANALRTVDAFDLLKASESLSTWEVWPLIRLRPVIEQESWPNAFMTEDVFNLVENKNIKTVPWIGASMTPKGEGVIFALRLLGHANLRAEFNKNFDELFKVVLDLPASGKPTEVAAVTERLLAEYMGGVHELNNATLDGFLELLGDYNFVHPLYKVIVLNVNGSAANRSLEGFIRFNYTGPYSFSPSFTNSSADFGAIHVDDMIYLFTLPSVVPNGFSKSSPEAELIKKYVGIYVEYAKTGKTEVFNEASSCTKNVLQKSNDSEFCDHLSVVNAPNPFQIDNKWRVDRMKLWDYVYNTLNVI
ncbi:unnamed protein product [Ceratitis capitata]|uniref:Carboxylic ester hydrolase n=1 Tax=Ceratitis capitata TaxID=7213 RepID=A0A811VHT2_CERCA|nr:unnamed protein product [Ceratitis capitata]